MEKVLLVISVILIVVVLLQSNKASDASQIITGGKNVNRGNYERKNIRNNRKRK